MSKVREQLENIKQKMKKGKYLLVGIDVGKKKHWACIMRSNGEVISRRFWFLNNRSEFERLVTEAKRNSNGCEILFGMEPTSVYWKPLFNYLDSRGEVVLTNPLWVKRNRQTYESSPDKNDMKDAYSIADMLAQGKFSLVHRRSKEKREMRSRLDQYDRKHQDLSRAKARLRLCLGVIFPEIEDFFTDISGKMILAILERWPRPKVLRQFSLDELVSHMRGSKIKFSKKKLSHVLELAKVSIGIAEEGEVLQGELVDLVREIKRLKMEIEKLEQEFRILYGGMEEVERLTTIKGIGILTASRIVSEIGDIDDFDHVKQLVKLAGLNLFGSQSGSSINSVRKITKKGSKRLRTALYQAALGVIRFEPEFRLRYEELLSHQPMKRKVKTKALIAIGAKVIRITYGMLKKREEYEREKLRMAA